MAYPPPPPPGYGSPGSGGQHPTGYPAPTPTNALAIVSLVAGIGSWVLLPFVAGVAAVVTGHLALGQIKRTREMGGGLAIAGLVLGYLNIVGAVVVLCFFGTLVAGCFGALVGGVPDLPTPSPTELPTLEPTFTPEPLPTG